MSRIMCGIFAVVACFILGGQLSDALTCNTCSLAVFGKCFFGDNEDCASGQQCYSGKALFPSLSSFSGFSRLGCLASSSCNTTMNGTILGAAYTVTLNCCNTDKCNNGAGSIQLSLTAAIGAALVATALNSWH